MSFGCLAPFSMGLTLKGKNLLLFKTRPHFGRALLSRETNRKSQMLFPLFIWLKNMEVYPYTYKKNKNIPELEQGLVVQSIVSLTNLLRGRLVKCFTTL